MKILVISLAGIGDTLLATPLIHELRANFPDAQIDTLVKEAGSKDFMAGNPHLNTVHYWNFLKEPKLETLAFLRKLRHQGYDVAINTHPQSRIVYRIIAWLIGARTRISHEYECFGLIDRLLVNQTLAQDYQKHSVENNLDILPLLGVKAVFSGHEIEIFLKDTDRDWADSFVLANKLSDRNVLGLHTGSGDTKNLMLKRWPLENYISFLRILKKSRPDVSVLLFGGPAEAEDLRRILLEIGAPFVLYAETKSFMQAAALMKKCSAFLSVDTALMHLAAAMKVPRQIVIEAFTLNPTNVPYGNPFTLIPNPAVQGRNLDFYRYDGKGIQGTREQLIQCMSAVSVEAVCEAVEKALKD